MREEAFVINKWSSWSLRSLMCVYTWSAWKSVWVRAKMVNRHEWIVLFSALLTFAKSVDLINTFSPLETVETIVLNQVLPNRETETKQVLKFNKAKFLKPFVFFFFFSNISFHRGFLYLTPSFALLPYLVVARSHFSIYFSSVQNFLFGVFPSCHFLWLSLPSRMLSVLFTLGLLGRTPSWPAPPVFSGYLLLVPVALLAPLVSATLPWVMTSPVPHCLLSVELPGLSWFHRALIPARHTAFVVFSSYTFCVFAPWAFFYFPCPWVAGITRWICCLYLHGTHVLAVYFLGSQDESVIINFSWNIELPVFSASKN